MVPEPEERLRFDRVGATPLAVKVTPFCKLMDPLPLLTISTPPLTEAVTEEPIVVPLPRVKILPPLLGAPPPRPVQLPLQGVCPAMEGMVAPTESTTRPPDPPVAEEAVS